MGAVASDPKLPLPTLTAMVVGGMVGAGVFSIPRNFALATGVYGARIAWAIAGAGMLMLASSSTRWRTASPTGTPASTPTRGRASGRTSASSPRSATGLTRASATSRTAC